MQTNLPQLSIRLLRKGCCNRPFYHIVVVPKDYVSTHEGYEQLGSYDPMANERNEKMMALNVERFQYWVAQGAWVRTPVAILMGLAGILPIHPQSLTFAWNSRREAAKEKETATQNGEPQ